MTKKHKVFGSSPIEDIENKGYSIVLKCPFCKKLVDTIIINPKFNTSHPGYAIDCQISDEKMWNTIKEHKCNLDKEENGKEREW